MQITVAQGENLWYYSQAFQIPLELILDSNKTMNPNQLYIGQSINIPGYVINTYRVQSGDTLWTIAQRRNISTQALLIANRSINPNQLMIGQQINIPIRVTWRVVDGIEKYDYQKMINDLNELVAIYPFLINRSIGNSVMGKSIPELRVGKGDKKVHYNGSFHANEWITTPIIMRFINDYALALTNQSTIRGLYLNPLYQQTELSIVPMVDPDGVNLVINGVPDQEPYRSEVIAINNGSQDFSNWKANIRGVDLNNQFPANWEIEAERKEQQPAPRDYPGPQPLSEPESIAMANLTRQSDFDRVLAFHTQGEVIYWGYQNQEPPYAETLVNEYARVSGYVPVKTVDSYAGYKDWFIQDWQRPGYTVELGKGVNPLPLSQFDEIYQETLGIFLANLYM